MEGWPSGMNHGRAPGCVRPISVSPDRPDPSSKLTYRSEHLPPGGPIGARPIGAELERRRWSLGQAQKEWTLDADIAIVSAQPLRSSLPPSLAITLPLRQVPTMSLKIQTSNVTNKNDPKSINSRVFIGNLNTAVVKKSDVETIFSKYGRVAGCSVHKGYAFVQYANERHARAAVLGENGRVLAGQTLDINMAGEPKPNRPKGLKRAASAIYSGYSFDCDYYRDDFYERLFDYRGRLSPVPVPRAVPVKRPRVTVPLVRRVKTTIPVKLFARSTAITTSSVKIKLKSSELQAIKTELTQIKSNIDALLGRLEQIAEEQKANPDGKKKGDSGSGSGSGNNGGSSRPLLPQEDTTSEAGTPQGEAQVRDDGDEEGLLTHSEEELEHSQDTDAEEGTLQ
ncbi:RNA-binding protein Raly [Myotis davidii]|uniref:RNA-binding protein Raly n=2 Tax=Myotis davidii TaxID=225400 RepID=L5LU83_MYODS|nr:RNA-binding protein Raly [Myotis davidii]